MGDLAQHTPGPWVATERSGYHEILAPCEDADWYGRPKSHAVAYCDTEIDEREQAANARLIAEAPVLLELMKKLVRITPHRTLDTSAPLFGSMKSAIAKVRGVA